MNFRMNRLMKELSDAINSSLAESDQISLALARIKEEGYDVYLVLEASAGPHFLEKLDDVQGDDEKLAWPPDRIAPLSREDRLTRWPVTAHDARFLKSLHILIDDAA
ncbi:MAG: hypothetical protein ACHP79_04950 [Terriglobales bacterium]